MKKRENRAQVFALVAFLFTLCFGTNLPALADDMATNTDLVTGSGTQQPVNATQTYQIRQNYFKRNPFAAARNSADTLQPVTGTSSDSKSTNRLQQSASNTTPQIGPSPAAMLVVPTYLNGFYAQPYIPEIQIPAQAKDTEIFKNLMTTFGLPVSDTQYQIIARENNQRALEISGDPERMMWAKQTEAQLQGASASNSLGGSATQGFNAAVTGVTNGPSAAGGAGGAAGGSSAMGALINIANENSGTPTASDATWKTVPGAIWMVQQMYKFVFVPMAILFLLPGAVLTQVKSQVSAGIMGQQGPSPFEGILRAMIAIFLIPATQLIMSYAIDVGNSLTYSVNDYVDTSVISSWSNQTIYTVPTGNVDNGIMPPPGSSSNAPGSSNSNSSSSNQSATSAADSFITSSLNSSLGTQAGGIAASLVMPELNSVLNGILGDIGLGSLNPLSFGSGGDGLGVDTPETSTIQERQLWLSQTLELVLNAAIYVFSMAVLILGAFQLVFMCYLFLLGPLAAAFFAWPVLGGSPSAPNSNVFSGWVDAVIIVSLWRFFWMVILAIMTQRILWMMDTGQKLSLQWEVTVFICLLGLMLYVPFHPWDYNPGTAFTQAMAAGQSLASTAGPAAGAAAQAAGIPSSQINAVGQAFGQVSQNISGLTGSQQTAAAEGMQSKGYAPTPGAPPPGGGNGSGGNGYGGGGESGATHGLTSPNNQTAIPSGNAGTTTAPPEQGSAPHGNAQGVEPPSPNTPVLQPSSVSGTPPNGGSVQDNPKAPESDRVKGAAEQATSQGGAADKIRGGESDPPPSSPSAPSGAAPAPTAPEPPPPPTSPSSPATSAGSPSATPPTAPSPDGGPPPIQEAGTPPSTDNYA